MTSNSFVLTVVPLTVMVRSEKINGFVVMSRSMAGNVPEFATADVCPTKSRSTFRAVPRLALNVALFTPTPVYVYTLVLRSMVT